MTETETETQCQVPLIPIACNVMLEQSFCVYSLHFYPRIGTKIMIWHRQKFTRKFVFAHADLKENMVEKFLQHS